MTDSARAWSEPSAVDYYVQQRHEVSDLYPSEKVFLPRVLFPGAKVLDIGCAAGGFFNIMRSLEPAIDYTGVDIAEPPIEIARRMYPEARFLVTDGVRLPFDDGEFDLVHCTSVLVIEPRYQELLKEMYRVSNRFVLADMRLLKGIGDQADQEQSYYRIEFEGQFEGTTVPYVVSDADQVVNFMLSLEPRPQALRGTGYFHATSPKARTPYSEVCMAIFLLQKWQKRQKGHHEPAKTELGLKDLPLDFSIDASLL